MRAARFGSVRPEVQILSPRLDLRQITNSKNGTDFPKVVPMSNIYLSRLSSQFLAWTLANRKPATHRHYADLLRHIVKHFPKDIQVRNLKRYHLTEVVSAHPDWGQNQQHNFFAAVNRLLAWGVEEGYLDSNPIQHLRKPARVARDAYWTPADYDLAMQHILSDDFRRLIAFAWQTGIRPQEASQMQVKDYDHDRHVVVLPPERSKGGRKHRIIYLTPEAEQLINTDGKQPNDPLFCSEKGKPWNRNSLNGQFKRLANRCGKSLHFGGIRKGYCTQALKNGVDVVTLAHLMGHADTSMIAKVYAKVHQDTSHMILNAIKAKG